MRTALFTVPTHTCYLKAAGQPICFFRGSSLERLDNASKSLVCRPQNIYIFEKVGSAIVDAQISWPRHTKTNIAQKKQGGIFRRLEVEQLPRHSENVLAAKAVQRSPLTDTIYLSEFVGLPCSLEHRL